MKSHRNTPAPPTLAPRKRCAIYTRKSTDEGLDQDYNSLEAQRDAGMAFVASQRHEGWTAVQDGYDDGGFSGGNLDRPALKRLMADIEDGRVDIVVVYKIDRLTRSLPDFAKLVDVFDRNAVNVGIPGTGLSYRQSLDNPGTPDERATRRSGARVLFWLVLAAVVIYVLVR